MFTFVPSIPNECAAGALINASELSGSSVFVSAAKALKEYMHMSEVHALLRARKRNMARVNLISM
ncbi:hypothetical protein D3C76_1512150 [compost metagenome]